MLTPATLVQDDLEPPDGEFWTRPEWYDEVTGEPGYTLSEVARFFFARSTSWMRHHVWRQHLVLDGEPIGIPRDSSNNYLRWRLYDVERTAHALAQNGYLQLDQLSRVIGLVKLVAQNYKYLLQSPIETRLEALNNIADRKGPMVVQTVSVRRDDLTGDEGAEVRRFAIEDQGYEIDLTDATWGQLLQLLNPYIAAARPDPRIRRVNPSEREERERIRGWARDNGYTVGKRGRIPHEVLEKYTQDMRSRPRGPADQAGD